VSVGGSRTVLLLFVTAVVCGHFGETEATRSPSAVRNSEIGRFVVMRVGSRFSYRWLISR
jgi:hypothetical protein